MIPVPSGVRVWLAVGHTDMRRGMNTLAVQVQQGLGRDPHAGDLYVFRGKRGHLIKILWHDGIGYLREIGADILAQIKLIPGDALAQLFSAIVHSRVPTLNTGYPPQAIDTHGSVLAIPAGRLCAKTASSRNHQNLHEIEDSRRI